MKGMMRDKIFRIYHLLLNHFGSQHWWPGDSCDEIIIGAILTQNTNWRNVEKALQNLKEINAVSLNKIVSLSKKELIERIRSAGFYQQKADRLKRVADFFVNKFKGEVPPIRHPECIGTLEGGDKFRQQLLNIKGIGEETADSILLYAFNLPYFVIDAYTRRIFYRLDLLEADIPYFKAQAFFHKYLGRDPAIYNEYHALLVRLAKKNCNTRPKCDSCPLLKECQRKGIG